MSKLSRTKGRTFELECCRLLKPFFKSVKRHLEYQAVEAKGYDLDNTGIFKIQCKRGRKYAPLNKIEEVQCDAKDIPLLITKGDYKEVMVGMYVNDFLRLLYALKHKGKI